MLTPCLDSYKDCFGIVYSFANERNIDEYGVVLLASQCPGLRFPGSERFRTAPRPTRWAHRPPVSPFYCGFCRGLTTHRGPSLRYVAPAGPGGPRSTAPDPRSDAWSCGFSLSRAAGPRGCGQVPEAS